MQFCADYTAKHLIPSLEKNVQKLKILTSKLVKTEKLKIYEKHFKAASKNVLRYLDISDSQYKDIKGTSYKISEEDAFKDMNDQEESKEEQEGKDESPSLISRCQVVLSSRNKPIEEVPSLPKKKVSNLRKFTPKPKPKSSVKLLKRKEETENDEITEYIKQGEIIYPKLIKDIVNKFDQEILVEAKKV